MSFFGFGKKTKCKTGFKRVGDKCMKKDKIPRNTPAKPGAMCSLDGKAFCGDDRPLKPPIARPGGKRQLADTIIKKMKPHDTYDEPFVGGGAVFLKKPKAKKNFINDKDSGVIAVFKSFKNKAGFTKCDMRAKKSKFERIKKKSKKTACDVAYLNKWSFGGAMRNFSLNKNGMKKKTYKERFHPSRKDAGIKYQNAHNGEYAEKLKNVNISSEDFKKVMQKSDSSKTVHFLDPPYFGQDGMYKEKGVTPKEVCDTAKKMKGQVIITYNDHPEVRKSCKGLHMEKISSRYTLGAESNTKKSKELLITNK